METLHKNNIVLFQHKATRLCQDKVAGGLCHPFGEMFPKLCVVKLSSYSRTQGPILFYYIYLWG